MTTDDAVTSLDYWIALNECVCHSKHPIGGCLKCDLQEIRKVLMLKLTMPTINAIRTAVADYLSSEGCSCCSDYDAHMAHKNALGKLLRAPQYSDKSGYDFRKFKTKKG